MLRCAPHCMGSVRCRPNKILKEEIMSRMLKDARSVAEAAVISLAIVTAALAVPAAILYAAV